MKAIKEVVPIIQTTTTPTMRPLKPRLSLLDDEFLMEMAKVGDFGTIKYAEEDWRDNAFVKVKARIDSAKRHLGKFASSAYSDLDDETNLSHMAHLAFNAMMLYWIAKHRSERDDRWKDTRNGQSISNK